MSERASMPATAPMTRRQIREAERLREAQQPTPLLQLRRRVSPGDSQSAHLATVPLDGTVAPVSGAVQATLTSAVPRQVRTAQLPGELPDAPAPTSRAARRAAEREAQAARRRAGRRQAVAWLPGARWMPRAAVLGALGAATIVAPLVGFAGAGADAPVEQAPVAAVPAGQSVLDALDAAALQHLDETGADAAAVMADNGAAARALVQSSRSVDRSGLMCSVSAGSGANGAGAALVREQVVMPLAASTYTQSSLYGYRVHPINGAWAMHAGLDFAAPLGTAVHSVADGVVVHSGQGIDGRSDMLVIIEHELDGESFYSWYVHMYPDGVFVEEGQQVRAGEVIAEVGNNGNSTGPHLHLEIHLDEEGTTTDPGSFLADHDALLLAADC